MPIIGSSQIKTTGAITLGDGPEDIHALNGFLSGSLETTASFGHIILGGSNFSTAVSSSAAASGFGTGGGGAEVSGIFTQTGSFFSTTNNLKLTGSLDMSSNLDVGGVLSIPGISNVSSSLATAIAGADNLGNHTASLDLDMNNNDIKNASTGSFGVLEVNGEKLGPFGIANVISAFEIDGNLDLMPNDSSVVNISDFNYETDENGDIMPRASSLI